MPMETNEMETNQDEKDASVRLRRPSIGKEDDNREDARANGNASHPNGNRQTNGDGWQASMPSIRCLPDSLESKSQPLEKSTCQPMRCFVSRVSYKHPVELRCLPSSGGASEHMRSTCKDGGPSTRSNGILHLWRTDVSLVALASTEGLGKGATSLSKHASFFDRVQMSHVRETDLRRDHRLHDEEIVVRHRRIHASVRLRRFHLCTWHSFSHLDHPFHPGES